MANIEECALAYSFALVGKLMVVVKIGEGPAKAASTRGAIHLIKKRRQTGDSSEAKRPNDPCSSRPRFSPAFLLQLRNGLWSTNLAMYN